VANSGDYLPLAELVDGNIKLETAKYFISSVFIHLERRYKEKNLLDNIFIYPGTVYMKKDFSDLLILSPVYTDDLNIGVLGGWSTCHLRFIPDMQYSYIFRIAMVIADALKLNVHNDPVLNVEGPNRLIHYNQLYYSFKIL
jgi:hypothetical protein